MYECYDFLEITINGTFHILFDRFFLSCDALIVTKVKVLPSNSNITFILLLSKLRMEMIS